MLTQILGVRIPLHSARQHLMSISANDLERRLRVINQLPLRSREEAVKRIIHAFDWLGVVGRPHVVSTNMEEIAVVDLH